MYTGDIYLLAVKEDFIDYYSKCLLTIVLLCMIIVDACTTSPRYTRTSGSGHPSQSVHRRTSHSASTNRFEASQIGYASYYANKFHGKKTASGERYYKDVYTAAHRTLPFNTIVRVTNLENDKSVIVRINDRGPFSKNRIIDISHCAATDLGLIKRGVGKVRVEIIE